MTTFTVKREKLFFDYGLTTADIQGYAKANNVSAKEAYESLKTQKANAGIGKEAFNSLDKSAYKGSTIKAGSNSAGIVGKSGGGQFLAQGKASAARAGQAGTTFNKGYNAGMNAGMKAGGTWSNAWKNTSKLGKAGVIGGAALLGGLAIKGLTSGKKKED